MEDEGDDTCTQASAISIFENHYHLTYMPFTTSEWNRLGGQKLPRKLSKKTAEEMILGGWAPSIFRQE